jgi:UDP-3-O-[3-hydroxymyristoyl] N-acetylglucosamine deacetylase/3-hydroxyacyl-[acyl-carrier-protein] dehydratase
VTVVRQQRTLKDAVVLEGVGIHTGERTVLTFHPSAPNTGIRFRIPKGEDYVEIPATVDQVPENTPFDRNTTLSRDGVSVSTVEHVLATLYGMQIDNCTLELNGPEPPEPEDGSCRQFVQRIQETGIVEQGVPAPVYEVRKPVQWSREGIGITAIPYDGFRVSFTIQYDNSVIGTQYASFDISPEIFAKEIAPARTFALKRDVNHLLGKGLIRGGTLHNALVVDEDEILNDEPLRFPDEFVRHKILDLLGDLSLLGLPIKGHIISLKSGHQPNVHFVRRLAAIEAGSNRVYRSKNPEYWDIRSIMDILPHRYPFLLVDRVLEVVPGERVRGLKNVTINEPFFQGHFPGHPIMPGVLLIEAMAQCGGVLMMSLLEQPETKLVYFSSIDKARFRKPVLPGDQVEFQLQMLRFRRNTCKMEGVAIVDGQTVAEAELLAAVVDR